MNKEESKILYELSVNSYVALFCKENDCNLECWIGGIGQVACISDMNIPFDDVKFCVDNDVNFDFLYHWYHFNVEAGKFMINLKSYCSLRKGQDMTDSHFTKYLNKFLEVCDD